MTAIINATIAAAPPSYLVVIIIISLVLHPTGYSAKYVWWLQSASGVRLLPPETVQPNRRRPELTPRVPTRSIRPPSPSPSPSRKWKTNTTRPWSIDTHHKYASARAGITNSDGSIVYRSIDLNYTPSRTLLFNETLRKTHFSHVTVTFSFKHASINRIDFIILYILHNTFQIIVIKSIEYVYNLSIL